MLCPKCQTSNDPFANFCSHCGSSFKAHTNVINSDKPLLAYFISLLIITLFNIAISIISKFTGPFFLLSIGFVNLISSFIPLLPAFAIQNRTWRIAAIVLSIVLIVFSGVKNILWMIEYSNHF